MKKIQRLVDRIDEEICGAKDYAESYLEYKAIGNSSTAAIYKKMASDELTHATYIHDIATQEIESLRTVYKPPVEMQEKWDKSHKHYVEKVAWIQQMLAM